MPISKRSKVSLAFFTIISVDIIIEIVGGMKISTTIPFISTSTMIGSTITNLCMSGKVSNWRAWRVCSCYPSDQFITGV